MGMHAVIKAARNDVLCRHNAHHVKNHCDQLVKLLERQSILSRIIHSFTRSLALTHMHLYS